MKLVASARLQKAQMRVHAARPFAEKIQHIIADLAASGTEVQHPLLEKRPEHNIAVIVIGADRGLAGSYHANVMRLVHRFLQDRVPETVRLVVLGKKATGSIRKLGFPVEAVHELPGVGVTFADIRPLSAAVQREFAAGEVDAVYVVSTQFQSAMTQRAVVHRLLPVETPGPAASGGPAGGDYEFEPAPEQLLVSLLSRYVDTLLFSAVMESIASEQGARMTSMSSATKNAGEMIDRLTLVLNRARQSAITTEIAEIVGTAEALK